MNPKGEFDVVVYGATGFTGRLVAEYLARRYGVGGEVSWAMAGRSASKLAEVRDEIGAPADTPLIVADAADPASLRAMVARAKAVLTTVGPYQLYGNELVAACAAHGVDYVDLCGEPAWMRAMIDAHEAAARASGARIVFSCGFDSIPFDLGMLMLQDAMRRQYGSTASRVRGRVRRMKGTFSGGTAASLQATTRRIVSPVPPAPLPVRKCTQVRSPSRLSLCVEMNPPGSITRARFSQWSGSRYLAQGPSTARAHGRRSVARAGQ